MIYSFYLGYTNYYPINLTLNSSKNTDLYVPHIYCNHKKIIRICMIILWLECGVLATAQNKLRIMFQENFFCFYDSVCM